MNKYITQIMILVSLLTGFAGTSLAAEWNLPLNVASGVTRTSAVIGISDKATNGYDSGYDAQNPFTDELLNAYFSHPEWNLVKSGKPVSSFYRDVRGTLPQDFILTIKTTLTPVTISWALNLLPATVNAIINDGSTAADMQKTTSFSYNPTGEITTLTIRVTPGDSTPPAIPVDLGFTATGNSIFLSWSANNEPDMGGYRLYFLDNQGVLTRTLDLKQATNYNLLNVPADVPYSVSVSAYDTTGNESGRSPIITAVRRSSEPVLPNDTTPPVVTSFMVPTLSKTLFVPITKLLATDNTTTIAGYNLTESSTTPLAQESGWSVVKPAGYTFASEGVKILYAWAKDSVGNVSLAKTAKVTIDTTAPTVTAFSVLPAVNTMKVPIKTFTAIDNNTVAGYMITLSETAPLATAKTWSTSRPTSYTVSSTGKKALYAWAKDKAGNVSAAASATVTIDTTAPVVSEFRVLMVKDFTIPITALAATDNIAVTGYLITEVSKAPTLTATGWKTTAPTSYTAAKAGTKKLYAWARDEAGNVSRAKTVTEKFIRKK